jgi:hypothetical protein
MSKTASLGCGFLLAAIAGCNPQALYMLMVPFVDNRLDPPYKLFADNKEIKLVILAGFTQPGMQLHKDLGPAETELPILLEQQFLMRCEENRNKIKIVPAAQVRNEQQKDPLRGESASVEIGKHFKADYALDLRIESFSLYEKKMAAAFTMFRGNTEITVNLYRLDKDGSNKVFTRRYQNQYPRGDLDARDVGNTPPAALRRVFLEKVAADISRMFLQFRPDEIKRMD